jgi:cytochrome c-type biogenesis protein CcmH
MNTFLIIAALMAVAAAATVALPLLRDKQSRVAGVVAAVLLMGAAAGLYPLWSTWNWHAPVAASAPAAPAMPDIGAMIAKLEKHLQDEPNDMTGWLMLGRSYMALERLDDAVAAYEHAHNLGKSADAALGLGEAMSLRAGGQISPAAAELFEEALKLSPGNPKALLYGGFAAATRGDRQLARSRWLALKELHPPPQIEQLLDTRIAELGLPDAAVGTSASQTGTNTSPEGSAPAHATVNITIAPALKSRVKPDTALFVFARQPGQGGPPLAVKRLTGAAIGTQVQLSAADSMLQGHALVNGQRVEVMARVSFQGQPTPVAGDLYGQVSYEVGRDGVIDLRIDRVAE